jgi:hypothetical protein
MLGEVPVAKKRAIDHSEQVKKWEKYRDQPMVERTPPSIPDSPPKTLRSMPLRKDSPLQKRATECLRLNGQEALAREMGSATTVGESLGVLNKSFAKKRG